MFRSLVACAAELAGIPLFESLSESDLQELASWFDRRDAGEGVRLIGEGAAGYSFFIVTEGSAVVTSEDATLADLGPGDFFGEIAILGDGRRTVRTYRERCRRARV
jgi:CRP-like cAMP-binding protein